MMRLLLPVLLVGACALPPEKGDTDAPGADTDVAADTDTTADTDLRETGDTAYAVDTDPCPTPLADACPPGETQMCGGACVPGFVATPPSSIGHDPRADCATFDEDFTRIPGAATPGYFGLRPWMVYQPVWSGLLLRNCWGEAEKGPHGYQDGTCDDRWNCQATAWDGGDCAAQPSVLGTSKTVRSAADVAAIQSFTELDTLEIDGRTMTTVSLPNLQRLHHLKVWGNGITSLSLPALTTVEGRVSLQGMPDLVTFSAPALTSVGGDWWRTANIQGEAVHVEDLDRLTSLDLHSLAHVGAGLRLLHVPKLAQVDLPALAQVMGGLYLQHMDATASVSVPALTNVGSHLQLRDLPRLGQVDLPVLQTVGGGVSLRELAALTSISAPTLRRAANVILRESYQVDHVSLPSLERIASSVRVHAHTVDLAHLRHVGDRLELGLSGTQAVDLCALEDASRINLVVGDGTPSVDLAAWHGEARELTVQRYGSTSPLVLSAPLIEGLGLLTLAGVTEAHLGALTHADGDITLNALRLLRAPRLTDVDTLCVQGVRAVTTSLPGIRVARQLIASYGGELQLPALEHVNWILATDWDRASLPSLTEIGGGQEHEACGRPSYRTSQPNTFAAGSFDLSALAHVQTLNLTSTMASSLPVLESATALSISSTSVVEAPLLSSVVSLTLNGAGPPLHAPNLTTLDSLAVSANAYPSPALYELPTLRTVRTIDLRASLVGELRMPDLERVETSLSTSFYMVQTLSFPSLVFLKSAHLPAIPHLDLSALVEADELRIGVDFKECERITTGVQPVWPTPMDLRLDALTTVGVLDVMHTVGPTALSFPKLATIHGRFRLIDLPALTRVDLPGITVIPDDVWITIRNVPALTTASLPNAREVGRLAFWNTGMTTIDYPNIRIFHDRISARENTLLRTLSYAHVTTAGGVDVGDNPLLDTLDLPSLTTVNGDVTIDFNTSLPTCDITPVVATWQISGTTQVIANEACAP